MPDDTDAPRARCGTCGGYDPPGCAWATLTSPPAWRRREYAKRKPTDGRWCRVWHPAATPSATPKEAPTP